MSSDIFNGFLLAAQQETHNKYGGGGNSNDVTLEVYQLNWQCVQLSPVDIAENSEAVLRRFAKSIQLDDRLLPYFCLYLVRRVENDYQPVRMFQNFESPYLTLCSENQRNQATTFKYVILVRKSYWDTDYDDDLHQDKAALNIIYWQALHEIEKSYVPASQEIRNRLTSLQARGDKIEVGRK